MSSLVQPRIQIAPVGFEIDRIVVPAKKEKADIVYLIMHSNLSVDKSTKYAEKIKDSLKKSKIKTETVYADRNNLLDIVKAVKEIILKHRQSEILINVSSGSKIHAIACMMGCMIFDDRKNIRPFYAEPEKYPAFKSNEQQTYGVKNVQPLPTYQMKTPKKELLEILTIIKNAGRIKKSELADMAIKRKIITINSTQNFKMARFTSLDKNVIRPLKDQWNFVDEEKIGRNRYIFLTEDGKLASQFLF